MKSDCLLLEMILWTRASCKPTQLIIDDSKERVLRYFHLIVKLSANFPIVYISQLHLDNSVNHIYQPPLSTQYINICVKVWGILTLGSSISFYLGTAVQVETIPESRKIIHLIFHSAKI